MSDARHTPGPWFCSQESADPEWWIVTIKGGLIVANVNAHFHQEANARLIASAPDLLADNARLRTALRLAIPYIERVAFTAPFEPARQKRKQDALRHLEQARAALAPAKQEG